MHAFHMVQQMAGMQLIPDEISCSPVTVLYCYSAMEKVVYVFLTLPALPLGI